jgi:hypothetical protein
MIDPPSIGRVGRRLGDLPNCVHVPFVTQPVLRPPEVEEFRYTLCTPVKLRAKVSEMLSVRFLPDVLRELAPANSVHCELDSVPATPGVSTGDTHPVSESLLRRSCLASAS